MDVEVEAQTTMLQEVAPTMLVAMGEELGVEGHLTKVSKVSIELDMQHLLVSVLMNKILNLAANSF